MKKIAIQLGCGISAITLSCPVAAGLTLGQADKDLGAVTISGAVRANYQDKHYGENADDQKIKFDAAILKVAYESPNWFGNAEYRCYQYDQFCDFSTLVYGYAGYHINPTDQITVGLQPIPFGPSRFWDSSFYASINNTIGLQDVHNLGVNYHFELASATKVDLAYFMEDGGHYHGDSRDAARYSANLVKSSDQSKTQLKEKNMWMMRVIQDLNFPVVTDLKSSIGASYWYSDIDNKKTNTDGSRKTWSVFGSLNYHNFSTTLTVGKLSIDNKDVLSPNSSALGSFDSEYELASEGYFYTFDSRYAVQNLRPNLTVSPYLMLSAYDKKQHDFKNSQRHAVGVAWDYKNLSLYTEYLMSKNDVFIGGNSASLAQGDDGQWNKLFNMMLVYSF